MTKELFINQSFPTKLGDLVVMKKLGKGKSGYSYLARYENTNVVLKLMHDEPCPYYTFSDSKVSLEINAYKKLQKFGIPIPQMLCFDQDRNYLVKKFIDGPTATEIISKNEINEEHIKQLFHIFTRAKYHSFNLDYFPSNFVIKKNQLFYIDYEINLYKSEWDLVNWGIYYWANSAGFKQFLETGEARFINESPESGIPIKAPVQQTVDKWVQNYNQTQDE